MADLTPISPTTDYDAANTTFGTAQDIPAPADIDGDGRADLMHFRAAQGMFVARRSGNNTDVNFTLGMTGDIPVATPFLLPQAPTVQFSAASFSIGESSPAATVTVTRTGDTTAAASVNFATASDTAFVNCATVSGVASSRCDFTAATGALNFAAGETSKSFSVLVNNDIFVEGNETFPVTLSNATGAALGAASAVVTITDNDTLAPDNNTGVAQLDDLQIVAAPTGAGNGTGSARLINNNTQLEINLMIFGLSSAQTAAHIRGPAHVGQNGPVVFTLPLGTVTNHMVSVNSTQVAQLKAGLFYFNVSTANFPNGEIRGQILLNPLESARFFVRQQYADFLSRQPDAGGFDFWTGQIVTTCGTDLNCIRQRRVDVSNAFFFELEFQKTGSYVYRLYRAAYGNNVPANLRNPDPATSCAGLPPPTLLGAHLPRHDIFASDRARLDASQLAATQLALANNFVTRAEFLALYPASQTAEQFVDALLGTIQAASGANLNSQRTALINLHNSSGRGAVLYRLADDDTAGNPINNRVFIDAEYNRAFVTTQYFGYLRRDGDICGLNFWLNVVNQFPLRSPTGQNGMVCAFITSQEYQERFSAGVTRSNAECAGNP